MISLTTEYALRAAVYLARYYPNSQTAAEIAAATDVPPGYLAKILQTMGRHGFLLSQRGIGGGFSLAGDPAILTVYDVLSSVEADLPHIEKCPLGIESHTTLCPLHRLIRDSLGLVEGAFKGATLASMLAGTDCPSPLGLGCQGKEKKP